MLLQENFRMGGSYKWPNIEDIVEYRRNVRNIILKVIVDTPLQLPITMDSPWVSAGGLLLFAALVIVSGGGSPLLPTVCT